MSFMLQNEVKSAVQNNGDSAALTVESVDNHVYYYAGIDSDRILALMKQLREIDTRLQNEHKARDLEGESTVPIWLHIQSYGGELFAGIAIADQLKQIASPVHSVIEGICASAATFMSMACDKRYILPKSKILIHQFTAWHWGTYEEFKDEVKLQDELIEDMTDFYEEHSNLKRKKIRKMLKHNTWLSSQEALDMGIVDEIKK